MKEEVKKRNIVAEVMIVIFGTFLIIVSFAGMKLLFVELTDEENELVNNACEQLDLNGNYSNEATECISNNCYLKRDNDIIEHNCKNSTANFILKEDYELVLEDYNKTKDMCNHIDENGLYLDLYDNYCVGGLCSLKNKDKEYKYKCPNIIAVNDEERIDDSIKSSLITYCESYNKGEVVKSENEFSKCIYNSCKITDEDKGMTYVLRCDSLNYRVFDKDQDEDDELVNKYLDASCLNKEIIEDRYKDNIRCSNDICTFHYKEVDYFKKCN